MPLGLKKKEDIEIMLCPKCQRPTLKQAFNTSGWLSQTTYQCKNNDCRYVGAVYLSVKASEIEKMNSEKRDNPEFDTNTDNNK